MRVSALIHRVEAVHALAKSDRIWVLGSSALLGGFPGPGATSVQRRQTVAAFGNTFRSPLCSIWPRVTPSWLCSFSSLQSCVPVTSPRSSAR